MQTGVCTPAIPPPLGHTKPASFQKRAAGRLIRGGGYAMSNSASWDIERRWIGAQIDSFDPIGIKESAGRLVRETESTGGF